MKRILAFLLLCVCVAPPVLAGAWQREQGKGFASAAARLSWPQEFSEYGSWTPTGQYYTLYVEYGLSNTVTGGLDLGRAVSGAAKTIAFLQFPLRDRDTGPKVAVALGLGQINGEPVVRPGLSVGLGLKNGWLSAESFAEVQFGTYKTDFKLDVTWGRNIAKDRKLILQLQSGIPHGEDAFVRLAPSIVFPVRDRIKVEVGASYGLSGDNSFGILLGMWTEF